MNEQGVKEFVCGDGTRLELRTRVSDKAKRQRLSLSHSGVLEVVIPARVAARKSAELKKAPGGKKLSSEELSKALAGALDEDAAAFVEQYRAWIERAAKRTKPQREAYAESKAAGLPTHLDFPLADELWLIEYKLTAAKSVMIKPDGLRRCEGAKQVFALKVSGNVADEPLCRKALARFVTQRAKELIPPFARRVCGEVGAKPRAITVNNRKSAWGVCTQAGDIRIDRKVLFFPADMARQVVLHEAAHLKHLNHSERFYSELFSYEGSTKEAERAVKKGAQLVPAWMLDT
jgi:predicted metal-dependent hydrolase